MIEIRYSRSMAGLDNVFDFYNISDYIQLPAEELRKEGTELRFYLSLFRKFNIIDSDQKGADHIWNTYFTCHINDVVFKLIYDNEYDIVSFAVDEKYIGQRESIAGYIRSLIEKEGLETRIDLGSAPDIHE